jgi:hypothetical protein
MSKRQLLKHGLSYTSEYRAWQQMRLRCTDPKHAAWPDYGGRGITVCTQWLNSPEQFVADMGKKPSPAHELDRENNDRGYFPENCRWVLRPTNCRNRRSNRCVTHAGETLTVAEWAERTGIGATVIVHRLNAGWSADRALTEAPRPKSAKGHARVDLRRPCFDCSKPVTGLRCIACSNRSRAANYSDQLAVRRAA